MNSTLKKNILQKTKKYLPHMVEAEQYIWSHPQTGFHEWDAHNYLVEKFLKLGFEVTEVGDIPGFYFDIDSGKEGPTIAILGELDAIILAEHPDCDPKTSAVHACGHHFQSSALLGIAGVLSEDEVLSELCGKIRIVAVPAEELIELGQRAQMRADGKIKYISGKSEFMRRGCFDDVDIAIMLHETDGNTSGLRIIAGTSGIIAKRVVFCGSENVSGAQPKNGVNALYAAQTAMTAINALRETFPHNQNVRVQSVITEGGASVQFIPARVVIESNIRAYDYKVLIDVNEKVNRAFSAAAVAMGAEVIIEDMEMYIPEDNSRIPELVDVAYQAGCEMFGIENSHKNLDRSRVSPGGTDMGNLGSVIPTIQPHLISPGTKGHCKDFHANNPEETVFNHAAVLVIMSCSQKRSALS